MIKHKTPIKTLHFGAAGYADNTIAPHYEDKQAKFIQRHKANENWNDYTTAGALSRYMLWQNKRSNTAINIRLKDSI